MPFFRRHLDSAQLGLAVLDRVDTAAAEHLATCAPCRQRRDRLAVRLAASRAGAHAAADAAFPAEVLERQRAAILHRISRLGAARVIAFPRAAADAPEPRPAWRGRERRWIVAAAAAGLVIGFAAGHWPRPAPAPAAVAVVAPSPAADPSRRDDALLSDVEQVLSLDSRPEFGALDGLTPIAYETR